MDILIVDSDASGEDSAIVQDLLRKSKRSSESCCDIRFIHDIGTIKDFTPSPSPDVIIVDLDDSDSNSISTIRMVSDKFTSSALVVLSSNSLGLEKEIFKLGVHDIVDKEYLNVGSLWKAVNYAANRKRMELAMLSDRENLDKANSILQATSEISRNILLGSTNIEEMMAAIGENLGVDGVAVFCGKCLLDGIPYCGWTGGKINEAVHLSSDCNGDEPLSEEIAGFIRYNLPVFTMIVNAPESVREIISWNSFSNTDKVVIVPIMIDKDPWGMFCFYTLNGKSWSVAEMDALATLSRLGGAIVKSKQLEDEMVTEFHKKFSEINNLMSKKVN
jgi:DNA-binding NarL/FixJ family response regulator